MADPQKQLMTLAQAEKENLAALLQGHPILTADRMINLLASATKASYYLRMAAQDHPETLVQALLQAAAVGLEPNTPLQHCALIPRKAKDGKWTANFQLMFRGRMHLATMHGGIVDWQGEAVYKQDYFAYNPASRIDPIEHRPELDTPKRPADLRGAYVIITLPSGMRRAKWMGMGEIEAIARRYSDSYKAYLHDKSKDDSPWVQRPGEMAIKTVANNIYKQIVLTAPAPVQIHGQMWERGPAAAALVPDEGEPEDAELTEEERPRPKETAKPIQKEEPKSEPRLATVVEAIEEVEADQELDRLVTAEEAQKIEATLDAANVSPSRLSKALAQCKVESWEELKFGQIPLFLSIAQGK